MLVFTIHSIILSIALSPIDTAIRTLPISLSIKLYYPYHFLHHTSHPHHISPITHPIPTSPSSFSLLSSSFCARVCTERKQQSIAFFHPSCGDGGGGRARSVALCPFSCSLLYLLLFLPLALLPTIYSHYLHHYHFHINNHYRGKKMINIFKICKL